jgi:Skp family chaperone for outer membrane proteins
MMTFRFRQSLALVCAVFWIVCAAPAAMAGGTEKGGSAADIKKGLNDTARAIRDFTMARKKELTAKIHSSLAAVDRSIEKFESDSKSNWAKMDKAARERSKAALQALKKQRTEAGMWYDRLQKSSARAWNQVKKGFANSWRALQKAFDNAEKAAPRRSSPHRGTIKSC